MAHGLLPHIYKYIYMSAFQCVKTREKPALSHLRWNGFCNLVDGVSRPNITWRRLKRAPLDFLPPVSSMLFPVVLLFLTAGHTDASPTLVEFVNSGLSVIGAKWVTPPSSQPEQEENENGTRQTNCRDCSRQVNKTPYKARILSQT